MDSILKGEVVSISGETTTNLPGTGLTQTVQSVKVEVRENGGVRTVEAVNSFTPVRPGMRVYLEKRDDAALPYNIVEISRTGILTVVLALFVLITALVGRKQGIRGLLSLAITIFILFAFLVPQILNGNASFLLIIGTVFMLTIVSAFVTHGKNRATYAAVLGMCATLLLTGILTVLAFNLSGMTGFVDESSVYFAASQDSAVDIRAIFLGSVLIGLLGVLYDAAISQAVYVAEAMRLSPDLGKREIMKSAMRIGREHIGALVDTLAIVSIGAALIDTLLLVQHATGPLGMILSRETVASHILQILIGSIGVILSVPLTTWIAVLIMKKSTGDSENRASSHLGHRH